jgi:hypothetical protein
MIIKYKEKILTVIDILDESDAFDFVLELENSTLFFAPKISENIVCEYPLYVQGVAGGFGRGRFRK